jgi:creatinine amidohydrolase/Fe(II)-dependent formamide hydrolase-like protein/sterol desaturase/sphingolipid hydroxylase (fatty acid hydroxylase superfamily)
MTHNSASSGITRGSSLFISEAFLNQFESIWELAVKLAAPFELFFANNDRVYWLYLWSAFTIAFFLYLVHKKSYAKAGIRTLEFFFPQRILFHRSAVNDYLFFYADRLFQTAFVGLLFASVFFELSRSAENYLGSWFPDLRGQLRNVENIGWATTLFMALIADFGLFLAHYLEHKIPWLWEFHKVHHSAEVMTPITVFRMHPVDNLFTYSLVGILSGLGAGGAMFLYGGDFPLYNVAGVNIVLIFFYFAGYNLRHSHFWWSWGPVLSRIFISPAQHQIHHSDEPRHFDKNMGFTFAIWDGLFGTLYVPKEKEALTFGLGPKENEKFSTFWSLYLMPFINLAQNFRPGMLLQPRRYLSVLVFLGVVGPALYWGSAGSSTAEIPAGVYLEDMTWQEVRDAIKAGSTIAIVPTGGTEQNGPHAVLGKHNYIVKYAVGKIAEKLGHALVAPVVTYVPEGVISPPEGHMRFPGTLSVSDATFEAVLEATAESLKQHGFKTIAFVGDSGGNQAAQQRVAERLNRLWQDSGALVIQVNDYYQNNGQVGYLASQGFSALQIGGHAGIRDTSELMFVQTTGVRRRFKEDHSGADFSLIGADGDAGKASPALGRILLDLKIDAAVRQIRNVLHGEPLR